MAKSNSNTGFPTIEEMRESQRKGNEGIGLNEQSYNADQADFNQGCGDSSDGDDNTIPSKVTPQAWMP